MAATHPDEAGPDGSTGPRAPRPDGVPVSTVHAWARTGYLPSVKIGRHRRFLHEDILKFIETLRSAA
jgi:excisionase family DNA binding protein